MEQRGSSIEWRPSSLERSVGSPRVHGAETRVTLPSRASSVAHPGGNPVLSGVFSDTVVVKQLLNHGQLILSSCRTMPAIWRNLSFFLCFRAISARDVSSGSRVKEKMLRTLSSAFMSPVFWKRRISASWLTFSKMLATAFLRCAVSNELPRTEGLTRRHSEDILSLFWGSWTQR